jgi:hypothetical protein
VARSYRHAYESSKAKDRGAGKAAGKAPAGRAKAGK